MVDIFIQFNTGFYKKGNLITSRKEIVINYLQTWFFLDLAASFPYNIFLYDENIIVTGDPLALQDGNNNTQVVDPDAGSSLSTSQILMLVRLTKILRVLRLLRILKLKQMLYKLEELIMDETFIAILNLLKVLFIVITIGHIIACCFYAIGDNADDSNNWLDRTEYKGLDSNTTVYLKG